MSGLLETRSLVYICTLAFVLWNIWFFTDRDIKEYLKGGICESYIGDFIKAACVLEVLDMALLFYHYIFILGLDKGLVRLMDDLGRVW